MMNRDMQKSSSERETTENLRFLPMVATVSDEFQGIGTLVQVIGHGHRESILGQVKHSLFYCCLFAI